MKNNLLYRLTIACLTTLFCSGLLLAQSVTFNVAGTNPHCISQYPTGVPYSGTASVSEIQGGGQIISVTFQLQTRVNPFFSWTNWSTPFTITPGSFVSQVSYSNATQGAPQLNPPGNNQIRMKAMIVLKANLGGAPFPVTVYSQSTMLSYIGAPTLLYEINGSTTSPTIPVVVFLCENPPVLEFLTPPTQALGTGVEWRFLMYESDANGNQGAPYSDFEGCGWMPGLPVNFGIDEYPSGCHRPGAFIITLDEYFLVRIELRNGCGTVSQNALIHILREPTASQVNFTLGGSLDADQYFDYGAGAGPTDETYHGVTSSGDGVLSWGGTYADPTWVGASTVSLLEDPANNFNGGLTGYSVRVEDVTAGEGAGQAILLGKVGGTGIPPTNFYLSNLAMGYPPAPKELGFFNTHFSELLNKIFKVTLSGNGVCGVNPSKTGYFKLIPDNVWWLTDPNQGTHTTLNNADQSLRIYPNPTQGMVTMEFNAGVDSEGMIQILDINGKVVGTTIVNMVKGNNLWNEDVSDLSPGNYVVQIISNNAMTNKKFTKI